MARTIADVEGCTDIEETFAGGAELPRYRSFAAAFAEIAGIKKGAVAPSLHFSHQTRCSLLHLPSAACRQTAYGSALDA